MAKAGRVRCGEGTESPSSPRRVFDRTGVAREAPAHRRAGSALPGNLPIAPFILQFSRSLCEASVGGFPAYRIVRKLETYATFAQNL